MLTCQLQNAIFEESGHPSSSEFMGLWCLAGLAGLLSGCLAGLPGWLLLGVTQSIPHRIGLKTHKFVNLFIEFYPEVDSHNFLNL